MQPKLLLFAVLLKPCNCVKSTHLAGGWGSWSYEYDASFFPLPEEVQLEHAHGIAISRDGSVVVTYKDKMNSSTCLLRWNKTGLGTESNISGYSLQPDILGPGKSLCEGVPHGLRDVREATDDHVFYHANNQQVVHKTKTNGDIIWSTSGKLNQSSDDPYSPTWVAALPGSTRLYLADGYGSSKIYLLDSETGDFLNHSFGGIGSDHGKFQTCHSISWDDRVGQMAVCDRENHRLEYFRLDRKDPSVFEYSHTVSFYPLLQRPCNIRIRRDGMAIIPALEGTVGIVDIENHLVSVINITKSLGGSGFLHPHDAHFVPGTDDFVLVTWNPGRIGYFRRVPFLNPATS